MLKPLTLALASLPVFSPAVQSTVQEPIPTQSKAIEAEKAIRQAKRELEELERSTRATVKDLEVRLKAARELLDQAATPNLKDYTPAHSLRQRYNQREAAWKARGKELIAAKAKGAREINGAEARLVELEWELKAEEREQLEVRIQRYLAEQGESADGESAEVEGHTIVEDDFRSARVKAAVAGKPLLVNVTGHTAINARLMETRLFKQAVVAGKLAGFVEARLHVDAADVARRADIAARVATLGASGATPEYVVLDPRNGRELGRFQGSTGDATVFLNFLSASREALGGPQPMATSEELWGRIFDLEDEVARLKADVKKASASTR